MLVSIRHIVLLMHIPDSDIVLYVFHIVIHSRTPLKFICMVTFMYCGVASDPSFNKVLVMGIMKLIST